MAELGQISITGPQQQDNFYSDLDAEASKIVEQSPYTQLDIEAAQVGFNATPEQDKGNFFKQELGALVRGGLGIEKAIAHFPVQLGWVIANLPEYVAKAWGHKPQYWTEKDILEHPGLGPTYKKFLDDLDRYAKWAVETHPEWEHNPPDTVVGYLTNPRELALAVTEMMPLLATAGLTTAGGRPDLSLALVTSTEGQSAKDNAVIQGASEVQANNVYWQYGIVAGFIEQYLHIRPGLKLLSTTRNRALTRGARQLAKRGTWEGAKNFIWPIIQETIEEPLQGAWEEWVDSSVIGTPAIQGGALEYANRRGIEALISGVSALIPGVGGATMGTVQKANFKHKLSKAGLSKSHANIVAEEIAQGKSVKEALAIAFATPDVETITPELKNDILTNQVNANIENDSTLEPVQKQEIENIVGNIRTRIIEKTIEKFPQEITDQKSLKEVGDAIAKELGIEGEIEWVWSKRKVKNIMGKKVSLDTKNKKYRITVYGKNPLHNKQSELKDTVIEELAHIVKPAKKVYLTEKEKQMWRESNPEISEERLNKIFKRRSMHHKEFKQWMKNAVKILEPEVQKIVEPISEVEPKTVDVMKENVQKYGQEKLQSMFQDWLQSPEGIKEKTELGLPEGHKFEQIALWETFNRSLLTEPSIPATVQSTTKQMAVPAGEGEGNLGLKWGTGRVKTPNTAPATEKFWNWYNTVGKAQALKAGYKVDKNWYGEWYVTKTEQAQPPAPTVTEPVPTVSETRIKPKKRSRKTLLALGHKIPAKLGLDDNARRDLIESITGKRSLKQLAPDELLSFIQTLESEYGTAELTEEDYQKPIQVGDTTTTMAKLMNSAAEDVEKLPARIKIPEKITKRFARRREGGLGKRLKSLLWGEENSSLYHLANVLGPTFSDVFDDNIRRSQSIQAGHARSVYNYLLNARTENKITDIDLARMSKHLNPRFQTVQRIQEMRGTGTEINTVEINGTLFEMTMADLMDVYLMAGQEDGIRHIFGGGLVINSIEAGALDEDTLSTIIKMVEDDPQAKLLCDTILEIGEKIWKWSINNVSQRMEGKDIAVVPNWWGLEVYHPRRLGGKQERFNINLIENRSIFKDRTKSERPLVVRDVFSRFAVFENGIAEYTGFAESTRIARGLINNPDISNALDQKGYGDTRKRIVTILERAQSLPRQEGAFGKFMAERLPGLYRAYLHFNPRVIISQYTSVMNYGAFVSAKYMTGIKDGLNAEAIKETLEMSDIAYDRFYMAHSNLALGEMTKSDSVLRMFTHKAADLNKLGITLRLADMGALAAGLQIAKAEYLDAQNGKIEGDSAIYWADKNTAFEEDTTDWTREITRRAEYLWQRSQPSWDKWNRSIMTSSLARQLFFPFRTFHEKSLTILQEANLEYERSNKTSSDRIRQVKKYSAVLSSYTLNTIIRAALIALVGRKLRRPWQYVSDLLEAPLSMFPILGTILKNSIGNFINVLIDEKFEFHGEAIEAFPARVINVLAQTPTDFSMAAGYLLNGDTVRAKIAFQRGLKKMYESIGTAEGVPTSEMKRVYKGWVVNEEEPTGSRRGRMRAKRVRPRGRGRVRARR